jgi:hypothetical protein
MRQAAQGVSRFGFRVESLRVTASGFGLSVQGSKSRIRNLEIAFFSSARIKMGWPYGTCKRKNPREKIGWPSKVPFAARCWNNKGAANSKRFLHVIVKGRTSTNPWYKQDLTPNRPLTCQRLAF